MDASLECCLGPLSSKTLRGCKFSSPEDDEKHCVWKKQKTTIDANDKLNHGKHKRC